MAPPPKLVVDHIRVAYGDHVVLDDLVLEVAVGETVAVVGPSGSGKSTLLRAIGGLEPLVDGRIMLDGRDLADIPPHRRGVGLMFQDHALFAHLSVADNIGYGLDREGRSRSERTARIDELLQMVGLAGFRERRVDQLSGGEAQRVALARALAPSPSLLMLDEPLGSLDRVLRAQLVNDLDRLLNRMGQTSLHVTHDQTEAFALADRVAVLSEGKLVRVGTPSELWDEPRTTFVAEFLGRPNIWELEIASDGMARWPAAGVALGRVGPAVLAAARTVDPDWPTTVVVPVEAVGEGQDHAVKASAPLVGHVVSSQFDRGHYRHLVLLSDSEADVTFVDRVARQSGDRISLTVDLEMLIPLGRPAL